MTGNHHHRHRCLLPDARRIVPAGLAAAIMVVAIIVPPPTAAASRELAAPDAKLYIIWPKDGQVIKGGKFWLRMGATNIGVAPAGVQKPNVGHYHLLINTDLPPLDDPIPNNKTHLHFGGGQTEARIELPPGRHTLQLLMGDAEHVAHDPPVASKRITVTVP